MQKYRMFELVREPIEEVPGVEKWSLVQLENPADPNFTNISKIKIATASKSFGQFRIEDTILALSQEHKFGQPPEHIRFSLPLKGFQGDFIIHGINNGKLAIVSGEIGSSDGQMIELPSPPGASQALLAWIEELSQEVCWED